MNLLGSAFKYQGRRHILMSNTYELKASTTPTFKAY